jgi:hypothetical protein
VRTAIGHNLRLPTVMVVKGRGPRAGGAPTDSEGVRLNWNASIRQIHRWVSIVFTVTVIANFVALARGVPPPWVTYSPLLPLALLLFTGLYLFVLPYAARRRRGPAGQ